MKPPSKAPREPYKLFDYYTFADRDLFFGREEEVLRTVGEVLSTRLLVLFAPSGSGKSSLINAGVRPKLEERGLATVTVRLDCAPDLAIKRRLREKFPEVFGALSDDTDLVAGLRAAYEAKDGQPAPKPLVLFLDQFEEFFIVFRDQPAVRRAFVKQVAQIKFDTSLPVYLVLSLRDDYFVHLNEFREEIPSIFHNNANIQLRPLDDAAALRAIVEPARICGLEFEPGLPEQIIADLKALNSGSAPAPGAADGALAVGPQERAQNSQAVPTSAEVGREGAPNSSRGGCAPQSPEDGCGVLPITLQIVCHKLWEKRPANGQPITRQLYGGDKQAGGLGGAATIIRRQLDESLRQIPRSEYGLMRKLFRVLMTADLTKRLRSIDDLAEILRLRDRDKLTALLKNLAAVCILREEHSDRQAWYEFTHDYVAKEVAAWLERFEARLRRRNRAFAWGFGVVPALVLAGLALWNFLSLEVRFTPKQYAEQEEELYVTRRFNPFGFEVDTGFLRSALADYASGNALAKGYPLRIAHPKDWRLMTNLLSRFNAARLVFISGPQPAAYSNLVAAIPLNLKHFQEFEKFAFAADFAAVAFFALKDASLLSPLLSCLQSTNTADRLRGVEVLAQLGSTNAPVIRGLIAVLKDSNSSVRQEAAAALGQLGEADVSVVEGLLALLKDSDSSVRCESADALGQLGQADAPVVAGLVALLQDSEKYVRAHAARSLGQLGKGDAPVVEGLLALLKNKDRDPGVFSSDDGRISAAAALGQLGNGDAPVIEGLLAALKDNDSYVRASAAKALVRLGKWDAMVAKGLLALPKGRDKFTRPRTAEGMDHLDKADAPVIEGLLALLKDSGEYVRHSAATVLGELGKADALVVEGLLASLKDSDSSVRESAAKALGQLGKADASVVEGLLALIKDSDSNVRANAVRALGQLGEADAFVVDGLLALLKGSDERVRRDAAEALGQLGKADALVVAGLLALLKDPNDDFVWYVRSSAAAALGQLGKADAPVVEGLLALLKDRASDVRQSAAAALGQLGKADAPVVEGLLALLKDGDLGVRKSAAEALGKLGQRKRKDGTFEWDDDWALAKLQDNLSGWRKTAGMALANRPNLTQATYDQVMALRLDSRPWVRLAAWDALLEIQKARDAREQAAKAAQPTPPAHPPQ